MARGNLQLQKMENAPDGHPSGAEMFRSDDTLVHALVDKLAEQTVPDIIRLPRNGSCDSSNSVFVPAGTDEELPFA